MKIEYELNWIAIQSKLCQYEEFASRYRPMQISLILWVCSPLLTQGNTSNFRFWLHLQFFVSLLLIISLRVFTSEANVLQKSKFTHWFVSYVNGFKERHLRPHLLHGQMRRIFIAAQFFCTKAQHTVLKAGIFLCLFITFERGGGGGIGVWKSADPCLFFAKSVDPPKFLFKSETTITSENRSVKAQRQTGTCECHC